MMDYAIALERVSKSFGKRQVVRDLSLNVRRGKITGFLGPNGSGKTTSMRIMGGLLKPDSGGGSCFGYNIRSQRGRIKPLVGFMTQKFSLWEPLTVRENLLFLARLHAIADPQRRVSQLLEAFSLTGFADALAAHLSGGWQQRVSLAACMLHSPQLILLDEPTAGVDPHARREFWRVLHALAQQGITILVSTHFMDEAERCHELAWIAGGSLLASGTADTIIAAQGLATWAIRGPALSDIEYRLSLSQSVEQTSIYSNTLYITCPQSSPVESLLGGLPRSYRIEKAATSLEDAFAHLMKKGPLP
ncbi:ABC transporter ATP-binding protein [uncultured Pluralibacter sp.]|uniref:ABC transporter ATP-binding protein n=1 Tax=uncultured Pluralibacter sp. TaxID=1490864 RepID=UPI0034508461